MYWFKPWLTTHISRHAITKLPKQGDAANFYEAWLAEFTRWRVAEDEAEAASQALVAKHAPAGKHFPMLMSEVFEYRRHRKRLAEPEAAADGQPVDCGVCGGSGSKTVNEEGSLYSFHACCVCKAGQSRMYMLKQSLGNDRHILTLADVRAGKSFRVNRPHGIEIVRYVEA